MDEDKSLMLVSGELSELASTLFQVVDISFLSNLSMFQDKDLAASLNRAHSMCNDDNRSILHCILNGVLNLLLVSFIQS